MEHRMGLGYGKEIERIPQLRESGKMENSMARQLEIIKMEIERNMR